MPVPPANICLLATLLRRLGPELTWYEIEHQRCVSSQVWWVDLMWIWMEKQGESLWLKHRSK
jgi:hypothetical protein